MVVTFLMGVIAGCCLMSLALLAGGMIRNPGVREDEWPPEDAPREVDPVYPPFRDCNVVPDPALRKHG